jgi:hypothetical protein
MERLYEQGRKAVEVAAAEARQGGVIGVLIGGQVAEGDVVVGGPFDGAGARDADAIAVEQQAGHQEGVIGGESTGVFAVVIGVEGGQVEFAHDIGDEAGQMILGEPVFEGRGQEEGLIEGASPEALIHYRKDGTLAP